MRTQIFVMTHRKFNIPLEPFYVPLHVGRAVAEDLGYLGDDMGDSISEFNKYYGELTGLYWLWKNYHDVDVIGICHYRRYFLNDKGQLMTQEEYEQVMTEADIMVSNTVRVEQTYKDFYAEAHNVDDLLMTGEVIKELYPEDYPAFCKVIEGNECYFGNLCVTTKKIFDEYCEWLFSIFSVLADRLDVSTYDAYHQRIFGFLSENLLKVYIVARDLKVKEGKIGITSEKAETIEFKLAIGQLVKMGEFSQAREMFYEYQKIRPDVRLEVSDLKQEIPDIELILNILEQEELRGLQGFYAVSHNLPTLIEHFRFLREIVRKEKMGFALNDEEQQYLKDKYVTEIAREVIRINL